MGLSNKEITAAWRAKKEEEDPEGWFAQRKGYWLKFTYGVTLEWYLAKLEEQNHLCGMCRKPPGKKALAVDHNHTTGQIRDLLCTTCNVRLAILENPEFMEIATTYLDKHAKQVSTGDFDTVPDKTVL